MRSCFARLSTSPQNKLEVTIQKQHAWCKGPFSLLFFSSLFVDHYQSLSFSKFYQLQSLTSTVFNSGKFFLRRNKVSVAVFTSALLKYAPRKGNMQPLQQHSVFPKSLLLVVTKGNPLVLFQHISRHDTYANCHLLP